MAQVALDINGRRYEVACDDGQEERLRELGRYVDERVRQLAGSVGQVGEPRLLMMASLLIADELYEATGQLGGGSAKAANGSAAEAQAAETLENVAERLERIAARLEGS